MDRLDLLLFTVFAPVFCLSFLMLMDFYSSFTERSRMSALRKYAAGFATAPIPVDRSTQAHINMQIAEEILSGRRNA
jgi:hypothetical protein